MDVNEELPPEAAMEILRQGGLVVTLNQAALILEFLIKLAEISLDTTNNDPGKL